MWQSSFSSHLVVLLAAILGPEERCHLWETGHNINLYSTPYTGWVYKWKFSPFVCLSVCSSVITSYYFPYSDSKLTQPPPVDLSHATSAMISNVPHPCLPCPPVNWSPFPVNWSPNEQDHISNWGRVMPQLEFFYCFWASKHIYSGPGKHEKCCCIWIMMIIYMHHNADHHLDQKLVHHSHISHTLVSEIVDAISEKTVWGLAIAIH